jgi:NAD(P)-dependent dehydrogenase (short-subunit alcohol dehydrogenase family)
MLSDKRVVITGAAQGIGEATAQAMAAYGARLLLADRNGAGAERVAAALRAGGAEAIPTTTDVTAAADCRAMIDRAVAVWGGLDVLVNSAGILLQQSVPDTSEEEWDRVMNVNVKGTFLPCKYAIPVMARQGGGVIVNLASGAALVGNRSLAAYGASKAAVLVLTKCMSVDHAADGIRVNCICPGNIDTEMLREPMRQSGDFDRAYHQIAASAPLARLGTRQEVAEVIAFMASDHCAYMTGTPIILDGGLTTMGTRLA